MGISALLPDFPCPRLRFVRAQQFGCNRAKSRLTVFSLVLVR